jgi:hypothetical protein
VPLALVASAALIITCVFVVCFTLHVHGIVGALLGDEADHAYSVVSLSLKLLTVSESGLASPVTLVFFQIVFVFTVAIVPLLWTLVLLALWTLPLRPRTLRSMLVLGETAYAWAMLDVYVVMVAASLLELDQVAKFTLGDECDVINKALRSYPPLGGLLPGEPDCFGVSPTLNIGFWLLTLAAVLSTAAGGFVMLTAHVALSEHDSRARIAARGVSPALSGAPSRGATPPPAAAPGAAGGGVHRRSASHSDHVATWASANATTTEGRPSHRRAVSNENQDARSQHREPLLGVRR